jgi:hypothetical protein
MNLLDPIPLSNNGSAVNIDINHILKYRIKHSDEIPKPDVVLQINDKVVVTRKNIFGITGKAKVGKTFLMTLINQAILLKGEFQDTLKSFLPKGKDVILYIDTEQSSFHVQLVLKRIYDVVGENRIENLHMYNFDAVPTLERYEFTKHLIYNTPNIGLVIIDGIADLVKSINDEIIACDTADALRRWATECDVAIGYVLHQNPSDSAKMRGHLGTLLTNKSESVLQIESVKENDSIKIVEAVQTRNAKPDNFSFEIIDGQPVIQEQLYEQPGAGRPKTRILKDYEKIQLLNKAYSFDIKNQGFSYVVLSEKIKEEHEIMFGKIGDNKIKELLKYSKDMNYIAQNTPKGNYFLQQIIN